MRAVWDLRSERRRRELVVLVNLRLSPSGSRRGLTRVRLDFLTSQYHFRFVFILKLILKSRLSTIRRSSNRWDAVKRWEAKGKTRYKGIWFWPCSSTTFSPSGSTTPQSESHLTPFLVRRPGSFGLRHANKEMIVRGESRLNRAARSRFLLTVGSRMGPPSV